jgi:serine/threonine protein kinase
MNCAGSVVAHLLAIMALTLPMNGEEPTAVFPAGRDPLLGLELQGFVITRALSAGGMGLLYEARHPLIGRRAAVKVLRPELGKDTDLSARFLREARAISAIKHRNVVEILNFGELPGGRQYLMMEFLEGESLSAAIAREAPMSPQRALRICDEILCGLAAAHQAGVVHRDLKPANIVLTKQADEGPIVKVVDFGLARLIGSSDTEALVLPSLADPPNDKSSILAGTPEYISPEQASGRQVDAQGDLYGLGVILFEMLTGTLPFKSSSPWELLQMHRATVPPRLSALSPGIDADLETFVDQLLAKNPTQRPLSAKAARESVERLVRTLRSPRLAETQRLEPSGLRRAALPFLAGVALFGVLGLIAMRLRGPAAPVGVAAPPAPHRATSHRPVPPEVEVAPVLAAPSHEPVELAPLPPRRARAKERQPVKARAHAVPKAVCVTDDQWRRAVGEQVEDLEKLSLAAISDTADPAEVARVKGRARALIAWTKSARGEVCEQIEAQLRAWRETLHW